MVLLTCSRSPCEPCSLPGHGHSGEATSEEVPCVCAGTVSGSFCWILYSLWLILWWVQRWNKLSYLVKFVEFDLKKKKKIQNKQIFSLCYLLYVMSCFFTNVSSFSTDALMDYTDGEFVVTGANATANIFASYPAEHLSVLNGFVDQVRIKPFLWSFLWYKCEGLAIMTFT